MTTSNPLSEIVTINANTTHLDALVADTADALVKTALSFERMLLAKIQHAIELGATPVAFLQQVRTEFKRITKNSNVSTKTIQNRLSDAVLIAEFDQKFDGVTSMQLRANQIRAVVKQQRMSITDKTAQANNAMVNSINALRKHASTAGWTLDMCIDAISAAFAQDAITVLQSQIDTAHAATIAV